MATLPAIQSTGISPMLTVIEVALLIRKSPFTVRKLARLGGLPGVKKIGNEWMFQRREIQRFVEGQAR